MSITTHFDSTAAGNGTRMQITAMATLASRLAAWWSARRAARQLDRFSDAMLKDIGLTRGDIQSAVRGDGPHRLEAFHNPFASTDNYR